MAVPGQNVDVRKQNLPMTGTYLHIFRHLCVNEIYLVYLFTQKIEKVILYERINALA
jgi:hypothetical protein